MCLFQHLYCNFGQFVMNVALILHAVTCPDLPELANGVITYTPPSDVSTFLPDEQRFIGTVATYDCLEGYQLANETMQNVCVQNGTWNETDIFCEGNILLLQQLLQ